VGVEVTVVVMGASMEGMRMSDLTTSARRSFRRRSILLPRRIGLGRPNEVRKTGTNIASHAVLVRSYR
jgi:hypothetical protein